MKIGIFCDSLSSIGGAERIVIELANYLKADIITSGYDNKVNEWLPIKTRVIDINNFFNRYSKPIGFLFEAPIRFLLNRNKFNYDIYIFSGTYSLFASKQGNKNIWLCHSPNRILYDLKQWRLKKASFYKKIGYIFHILLFYYIDQYIVKNNVLRIITDNKNIYNRVKKYYKKDSKIIYCSINTSLYKFKKIGDYYLSISRLFPEKRVDIIARAFTKMPDKKLVIVGDGPELNKINNIIKKSKNIIIKNNLSEKELINLYANCLATIYLPLNEDYGLIPIESMASGKICIAANEGGCKETIIHGKTGFLIKANELKLIKIINNFNYKKAKKMKTYCIKQAKKFDIYNFLDKWKIIINTI